MRNNKRPRSPSEIGKKRIKKVDASISNSESSGDCSVDDSVGHFNPVLKGHCRIKGRYIVWEELGTGTFGKVFECEGIYKFPAGFLVLNNNCR